jgi:hypothetical protein
MLLVLTVKSLRVQTMKFLIGILLFLASTIAQADRVEDKVRKLFEVQDIVATYQSLIDETRSQAKEEMRQISDQVLNQLNANQEVRVRMTRAGDKYMKALLTDRTAEQIVEVLIKYYAPNFSEQEVDKLIAFYSSDIGKKEAAASKSASVKLMTHYKAENQRILTSATNEYVHDLQIIAQQCKCAKPAPPPNKI